MSDPADRFWAKLQALYLAADKPTLKRLVRLGLEQRPEISISDSTINGWLNRKAVPVGRKNERYLLTMVAFLQGRVISDARYEPLSPLEWGRLLHEAQSERAAGKQRGRGTADHARLSVMDGTVSDCQRTLTPSAGVTIGASRLLACCSAGIASWRCSPGLWRMWRRGGAMRC